MTNKDFPWSIDFWQAWLSQAPILCVDAVIFNNKQEVVLVKRSSQPFQGYWHLPGGIVRKGETLDRALRRVILTEVGIKEFKIIKQLGVFDDPQRDPRGHFITMVFIVGTDEKLVKFNSQNEEIKFFKDLPTKLGFDAGEIVNLARKN